jgi:hypothetical protein
VPVEKSEIGAQIVKRFIREIDNDERIPSQVARRIRALYAQGRLDSVDRVLEALREGVREHAQDRQP